MKNEHIQIRCTAEQKAYLQAQADAAEMSLSLFILWSVIPELDSTGGSEVEVDQPEEVVVKPIVKAVVKEKPRAAAAKFSTIADLDAKAANRMDGWDDRRRAQFERSQGLKKYK